MSCITKLVDYFAGYQHLDHADGWGLNDATGSKQKTLTLTSNGEYYEFRKLS